MNNHIISHTLLERTDPSVYFGKKAAPWWGDSSAGRCSCGPGSYHPSGWSIKYVLIVVNIWNMWLRCVFLFLEIYERWGKSMVFQEQVHILNGWFEPVFHGWPDGIQIFHDQKCLSFLNVKSFSPPNKNLPNHGRFSWYLWLRSRH